MSFLNSYWKPCGLLSPSTKNVACFYNVYSLCPQDVFNLLPDVGVPELVTSLTVSTNDQMSVVYLASLVRSIMALHNLINNKVSGTVVLV